MITRKVDRNDHLAGFTYGWVKAIADALAVRGGKLTVVCLEQGDTHGLEEVSIISLGKERGYSRMRRVWHFITRAWPLVATHDAVFCHMNPEYTIAIGLPARLYRRPVISWYTHSAVTFRLWLLEKIATKIITASAESFTMRSSKVKALGHGIDTSLFAYADHAFHAPVRLLTIGRISPTKDYESMIQAVRIARQAGYLCTLRIIGAPGLPEHVAYAERLKELVGALQLEDAVEFIGPVPHQKLPTELHSADIFINLSGTGSLDKAVLEAMAAGCIVITSNKAFKPLLPDSLFIEQNNHKALAEKITFLANLSVDDREALREHCRAVVQRDHALPRLAEKIVATCLEQIP